MKRLLFISLIPFASSALAENVVPEPFDPGRYSESLGKSPFVLATKVVEAPAPADSFTKDLYLRAVSTNQDGKYYVLLQRLGEEKAIHLEGSNPDDDGMMIKEVKVGADFRQTKVTLQKGAEIGEVGFKEEAITSVPPNPGPGPQGAGGRFPGGRPTAVPIPRSPTPNPGVRPPRNPGADLLNQILPNTEGTPTNRPGGGANRRQRVRVINP